MTTQPDPAERDAPLCPRCNTYADMPWDACGPDHYRQVVVEQWGKANEAAGYPVERDEHGLVKTPEVVYGPGGHAYLVTDPVLQLWTPPRLDAFVHFDPDEGLPTSAPEPERTHDVEVVNSAGEKVAGYDVPSLPAAGDDDVHAYDLMHAGDATPVQRLVFHQPEGQWPVTIAAVDAKRGVLHLADVASVDLDTGKVTLHREDALDEGARAFWQAVEHLAPR